MAQRQHGLDGSNEPLDFFFIFRELRPEHLESNGLAVLIVSRLEDGADLSFAEDGANLSNSPGSVR